jgi:hypothetical protein
MQQYIYFGKGVIYSVSANGLNVGREPLFREDLNTEVKEYALLEPLLLDVWSVVVDGYWFRLLVARCCV